MFGNISDKELEVIDNYFVQLLEYTRYKKNRFNYIEKTGNKKLDKLLNKWNSLIEEADKDIRITSYNVCYTKLLRYTVYCIKNENYLIFFLIII